MSIRFGYNGLYGGLTVDWTGETVPSGVAAVAAAADDDACARDTIGIVDLGDEEDIADPSRRGIWRSGLATAMAAGM